MDFEESLSYLENSSYGHSRDFGNFKKALALFNVKESDFKIIQIAGTNGKGTVGTFLSQFIEKSGNTVGHFTSPHLEDYRERFKVNNCIIEEKIFIEVVKYIKNSLDKDLKKELTYFENSFLIALLIFKKYKVQYVILEAGIGGRNDITNIFSKNELSIITTIGYDHTKILGETLEKIAWHKAGIIKENSKVVSFNHNGTVDETFEKESKLLNSKIGFLKEEDVEIYKTSLNGSEFTYKNINFHTSMVGIHQTYNISLAFEAFSKLGIDYNIKDIKEVVKNFKFEGRMEKIHSNPDIYVDGAHNSEGIETLANNLEKLNIKNYTLVLGSMSDKNIFESLNRLVKGAKSIILTKIQYERAIEPKKMAKILNLKENYTIVENIEKLPENIVQKVSKNDIVIVTGSLYLVGEIKTLFKENQHGR